MIELDRISKLIEDGLRPSNGLDIDQVEEAKIKKVRFTKGLEDQITKEYRTAHLKGKWHGKNMGD